MEFLIKRSFLRLRALLVISFILTVCGITELYEQLKKHGDTSYVLPSEMQPISNEDDNVTIARWIDWQNHDKTSNSVMRKGSSQPSREQHVTPPLTELLDISYQSSLDRRIENLEQIDIPFLPNYKNPCWFEKVEDISELYQENIYIKFRDSFGVLKDEFRAMEQIMSDRAVTDGYSWRMRCLPYFYVAGAPRCGTTDLQVVLLEHPQVAKWPLKEAVFWNRVRYLRPQIIGGSNTSQYHELPVPLQQYLEFYDKTAETVRVASDPNMIVGDISPSYMYDFDAWRHIPANERVGEPRYTAPNLIHTVNPTARIIFILRDPVQRLLSDYNFFLAKVKNRTAAGFHSLVVSSKVNLERCFRTHSLTACLHDRDVNIPNLPLRFRAGVYLPFLEEWIRVFPRKNILVLRYEDYVRDKKASLNVLMKLLELDNMPESWYVKVASHEPRNQGTKYNSHPLKAMYNYTKSILYDFYQPWNEKLARFLQDDRFLWLN